ncbi:hypothetical protein ACLB2K_059718 [Fragaria x ananassa]
MEKEETCKVAEKGERPQSSSLISDQSQEENEKAKEVEMRRLTEENERLRCQIECLKEEMRKMEEVYESRQTDLWEKLEDAVHDLMVERIINNETRVKNEKLNEELKKPQALVAALAPYSQDDQDPKGGANKGGKINEDLKDKEADKVAEEDDDKEDEAAENIAHLPTQNSEDLYVEELERVEEELKKKKKAEDETKAYCEPPPESPPRRTVTGEARWSPKTPVTDMLSFDLGISPWVEVHVINLDEEESDIEIELTKEDSGRTASSLGMYSYVARIKNKQRRLAKRDDIYWWGEVKKTREKKAKEIAEERKKNLEQKTKNKI